MTLRVLLALCIVGWFAFVVAFWALHRLWGQKLSEGQLRSQLLEAVRQPLLVSLADRIVYCNSAAERLFGYPPGQLEGQRLSELFAGPAPYHLAALCTGRGDYARDISCRRADGSTFRANLRITLLHRQGEDEPWGYAIAATDVTDERAEQQQLAAAASTDELTGLHNRRSFLRVLGAEVKRAERYDRTLSLAILDIDHFKQVNDRFGHQAGDQVLRRLADLLRDAVRSSDVLCRYGGEEFALLLPETPGALAQRLCERLRRSVQNADWGDGVSGPERVTVTIGVAEFPGDTSDVDGLVKCADERLYEGKQGGRNRVVSARDVAQPQAASSETAA